MRRRSSKVSVYGEIKVLGLGVEGKWARVRRFGPIGFGNLVIRLLGSIGFCLKGEGFGLDRINEPGFLV